MGHLILDHSRILEQISVKFINRCFEHFVKGGFVRQFCKAEDISISAFTIMVTHCAELNLAYTEARRDHVDVMVEDMIEEIDTTDITTTITTRSGEEKVMTDQAKAAKLRVKADFIKWYAARSAPKKYGDRIDVNSQVTVVAESPLQQLRKVSGVDQIVEAAPAPSDRVIDVNVNPVTAALDDPDYIPPVRDPNEQIVPEDQDGFEKDGEDVVLYLKDDLIEQRVKSREANARFRAKKKRLALEGPPIEDLI